jgi:hypothetical protein
MGSVFRGNVDLVTPCKLSTALPTDERLDYRFAL